MSGIKISALPPVTDSSNLTLPANQSGVTSKVGTSGANSLAYKDASGKITIDQLPDVILGGLNYKGVWNATTNIPVLGNSGAGGIKGDYYVVSVAGSTSLDGISDWQVGDWLINNGATWDKVDNTDAVTSVNGFTGTVVLGASNIGNTPSGTVSATDVQGAINELDSEKQPIDATLSALSGFNTNGLLTQTAPDTFTGRTIVGTANQVNVANGNGGSGNPTLSTPQNIHTAATPTFDSLTLTNDLTVKRIAAGSNAVFGTDGDGYTRQWDFSETISDFSASPGWAPFYSHIFLDPTVDLTGGNQKSTYSHDVETYIKAGNSKDFYFVNNLYSGFFHNGSGDVDTAIATTSDAVIFGGANVQSMVGSVSRALNFSSGTITDNRGLSTTTGNLGGGIIINNYSHIIATPLGTLTGNNYGLFLATQDVTANSWSIYSNGGKSYFRDRVGFGVNASDPRKTVEINGFLTSPEIYISLSALNHPFTDYQPSDVACSIRSDDSFGGINFYSYSSFDSSAFSIISGIGSASPTAPVTSIDFSKTNGASGKSSLSGSEIGFRVTNNNSPAVDVLGDKSLRVWGDLRLLSGALFRRIVTGTDYTIDVIDYYVGVSDTTSPRAISLPPAASAENGRVYIIKDESGGAGTNNIIINPDGSELIDGVATKSISTNYGAMTVICDGSQWFVI